MYQQLQAPAEEAAKPAGKYSFDKQQVGELTDGLILEDIRHTDHKDYYRIVFDFGEAKVVPFTTAEFWPSARLIKLFIGGVRRDFTGNKAEEPIIVNDEVVASYTREITYDDSSAAYTIALNRDAKFYLHALENPVRIIVDIEK